MAQIRVMHSQLNRFSQLIWSAFQLERKNGNKQIKEIIGEEKLDCAYLFEQEKRWRMVYDLSGVDWISTGFGQSANNSQEMYFFFKFQIRRRRIKENHLIWLFETAGFMFFFAWNIFFSF